MIALKLILERMNSNHVWLALILVLLLWRIPYYGKFVLDDPFITFRYAANLVEQGQFTYNLDQFVLATTTPVYGLIAVGFEVLGIPARWGALVFNLGCEIALLYIMGQIIGMIVPRQRLPVAFTTAGLLMLSNRAFSIASNSGMETALFVLLNITTLLYIMRRRYVYATAAGSLATLTRPDGIFALVVLALVIVIQERRLPLREVGISALIAAPWVIVATLTYGQPIPQSVLAKGASVDLWQTSYLLKNLRVAFYEPLRFFGIVALLPLVIGLRHLWTVRPAGLALLLFTVAHLVYLALPSNSGFEWYFAPLYAALNLSIGVGVAVLLAHRWIGRAVLGILLVGIVYSSVGNYLSVNTIDSIWRAGMLRAADYLNEQAADDAVVQCTNIGIIGYYTGLKILDPLGLASPEVTPLFDEAADIPSLSRLVAAKFQPDYITSFGPETYAGYEPVAEFETSDIPIIIYRRADLDPHTP